MTALSCTLCPPLPLLLPSLPPPPLPLPPLLPSPSAPLPLSFRRSRIVTRIRHLGCWETCLMGGEGGGGSTAACCERGLHQQAPPRPFCSTSQPLHTPPASMQAPHCTPPHLELVHLRQRHLLAPPPVKGGLGAGAARHALHARPAHAPIAAVAGCAGKGSVVCCGAGREEMAELTLAGRQAGLGLLLHRASHAWPLVIPFTVRIH